MDLGLKGKVIAVTGGGEGIGGAITRACLAEGATVVVIARSTANVKTFVAEMTETKAACNFFEAQLEDDAACRAALEYIASKHGRLYGLVNNAGTNDGVGLENGSPQRFLESLKQNVMHYYAMAHYALPMLKAERGCIVNISSKVALTGQGGTSGYAAAKGGQLALTREWAAELLPFGIRVNSIVPAEVMTPQYQWWLRTREDPEQALQAIARKVPLDKRMTHAEEIAAMAVFLMSPTQSAHTTAQHMVVDGGYVHLDRALT